MVNIASTDRLFGDLSIRKNLNNGQIAKHGPTMIKINDSQFFNIFCHVMPDYCFQISSKHFSLKFTRAFLSIRDLITPSNEAVTPFLFVT